MPTNYEQPTQQLTFDAIKIGLASITELSSLKRTVFSVKRFSGLVKTGNVIVENTKKSATKA